MKSKYDTLSKVEKKELYNSYKTKNRDLIKKLERLKNICIVGIIYGILMIFIDIFYNNKSFYIILDIVVALFCIFSLIKLNLIKKKLLIKFMNKKNKSN